MGKLAKRETIIILSGKLTEEKRQKAVKEITQKISNIETIEETEKKALAYSVQRQKTGFFVTLTYNATGQKVAYFEKFLHDNINVLKFLTIKI